MIMRQGDGYHSLFRRTAVESARPLHEAADMDRYGPSHQDASHEDHPSDAGQGPPEEREGVPGHPVIKGQNHLRSPIGNPGLSRGKHP